MKLVLVIIFLISVADSAKILGIFPVPSKSHYILGSALMKALAKKGHNVTFVNPYSTNKPMQNLREIPVPELETFKQEYMSSSLDPKIPAWKSFKNIFNSFVTLGEVIWESKNFVKLIKSDEKFDVVILDYVLNDALLGVGKHFNASNILFSPVDDFPMLNRMSGIPYVIADHLPLFDFGIDLITRTFSFILTLLLSFALNFVTDPFNEKLMKNYLPDSPPLSEIQSNVSLILVNGHFSIGLPRPYVPNMVTIGGYHVCEQNPLPNDIQKFLDEAKEGAILFSMGSNVQISTFAEQDLKTIIDGLGKASPLRVIFKSDIDIPNPPKNMKVMKWVPQNDILAHSNVKVFISHGGYGGMTEAIYNGVPILGIPFFGDQSKNVNELVNKGYGLRLDHNDIVENFEQNLNQLISNSSYSNEIKKTSVLLKDQPMKPIDKAIYWIEYVVRHNGAHHLKTVSANQTWYRYYSLDVIFVLVLIILINTIISLICIRSFYRMLRKKLFIKKIKTN